MTGVTSAPKSFRKFPVPFAVNAFITTPDAGVCDPVDSHKLTSVDNNTLSFSSAHNVRVQSE